MGWLEKNECDPSDKLGLVRTAISMQWIVASEFGLSLKIQRIIIASFMPIWLGRKHWRSRSVFSMSCSWRQGERGRTMHVVSVTI